MKTKQIIARLLLFTFSFLTLASARAQVEQVATDSGKEITAGTPVSNGVATQVRGGGTATVTTKTLLEDLALDETLVRNWFPKYSDKVPANAKLEIIYPVRGDFSSISYRVVSGTNMVFVTNVLSGSAAAGVTNVTSQTTVDTNNFEEGPFSYTVYQEFTISYDARPVGGHLFYEVTGLAECSAVAGKTNPKNGKFTETDSFTLTDGTGSGENTAGTIFLISGVSVHANGSGTQEALRFGASSPSGGNVDESGWEWSDGAVDTTISAPIQPSQAVIAP